MLFSTHQVIEIQSFLEKQRAHGHKIAFVPTMGALHDGHLSLVELAREHADIVVASIFVNPTQFAAHEDLDSYPRDEEADMKKLVSAGCHAVFYPTEDTMYPIGQEGGTFVEVKAITDHLCGSSRPHFFGGVATVVTKLLNIIRADYAIFGEKDYQQLLVIKSLARDLFINTEIIGAPIIRDHDGLAMSSRNAYLSSHERIIAGQLNVMMKDCITAIMSGQHDALDQAKDKLERAGLAPIDYFEVRHADDLRLIDRRDFTVKTEKNWRLFAAVMLGNTRLIDNMAIKS